MVFGSIAALGLLIGVGVVGFIVYAGQDPKGVAVSVEGPSNVKLNEEFALTVVVHNERAKKDFGLTDIDVAEGYLQGFQILGTDPDPSRACTCR